MKRVKKGRRIYRHDTHLILNTFLFLNFPFFVLMGLVGYFGVYVNGLYDRFNWYYVLIVLILLLAVCLSLFLYFSSNSKLVLWWDKKKHRQMLARMVMTQGYYVSEMVDRREKIVYFPKIYYRLENEHLYLRFPLRLEKFQDVFLALAPSLEVAFSSDLYKKTTEKEYVCYELLYMPSNLRTTLASLKYDKKTIEVMRGIKWEFAKVPHALITGGTGSGKTFLLNSIIWSFARLGADLVICDPKNSDLSKLRYVNTFEKRVYVESAQIVGAIRRFRQDMDKRMVDFEERTGERAGLNYYDLDYKPQVLVIDEYNSLVGSLRRDFQMLKDVEEHISRIVMLGRQLGFFVVIGMQRPDGEYIHTAVRDNLGFRVALGAMSSAGYSMMFGESSKKYQTRDDVGYGYCFVGFGEVFQFYAPYIAKDFDFIKEMKRLYQNRKPLVAQKDGDGS